MNSVLLYRVQLLLLLYCGMVQAQPTLFYRVSASTNTTITSLSPQGVLSWSNAATVGTFVVERSSTLSSNVWTPRMRNDISNAVTTVKVQDDGAPSGMVYIPGGKFTMGDILGEQPGNNATPVHTVYLSPFYMKIHHVSNAEMCNVMQWAYNQGLITVATNGVPSTDGSTNVLIALGKHDSDIVFNQGVFSTRLSRTNYPAIWVSWFGAAAYCNFLSAMEGRQQCYDLTNWTCDFSKTGYRLPTESEREYAARGGYEGLRFPWADTNIIDQTRANYQCNTNTYSYDLGPTPGLNPAFKNFPGAPYPNTPNSSPLGYFPPNNFGLYDMSGNVWDWCWDWGGKYLGTTQFDPTGPAGGTYRVFRGGSWLTVPSSTTCAARYTVAVPSTVFDDIGFRTALRASN